MVTKDLTKRGIDKFKDKYHYNWLGKKQHTTGYSNWLWIHRYLNGVKIRKRNEGIIVLNNNDLQNISFAFKDLACLFTEEELDIIWHKFPSAKEFIERLKNRQVSYEERENIRKGYKMKEMITNALER